MLKGFCLFFLLLSLFSPKKVVAAYSLADLEVLASEGSSEEFFKHALDVRPSERQGPWKGMVTKMGDIFTRSILKKSEITPQEFKKVESLYQWPALKSDDVFKQRRHEIGLRYLSKCVKSKSPCWEEVKTFWEADPQDPEVAYKISDLVIQHPESPLKAWTFLDVALKSSLSEFYCQKPFVMEAIWGKFEIDYIRLGPKGDLLKKIDQTVHPDCLPHLNATARQKLMRPEKVSDRELAYQLLKAQGKADQRMTDLFYVVYLLEKPSQGELFNYAWNRLKELGSSSLRRENVLTAMGGLDPLPDELLATMDETKKRVILTHFKQNFPEYLDFYANQCLNFYGGQVAFPQGNPTINCQSLMGSDLGKQVLGPDKIQRYKEVRKI